MEQEGIQWDYHVECLPVDPVAANDVLRERGMDGWELVAVVNQAEEISGTASSSIVAYFKQPLEQISN